MIRLALLGLVLAAATACECKDRAVIVNDLRSTPRAVCSEEHRSVRILNDGAERTVVVCRCEDAER